MKKELSGFQTVGIEVKFNDGFRETMYPYIWLTQYGVFNDEESVIVIPVSAWQDLDRAAALAVTEVYE